MLISNEAIYNNDRVARSLNMLHTVRRKCKCPICFESARKGQSMDKLNTTGKLFGEITALRIVMQRLLGQMASQTGNFDEVLRTEHAAALIDLSHLDIADVDPARGEGIRMHAEQVIEQMHTVISRDLVPSDKDHA